MKLTATGSIDWKKCLGGTFLASEYIDAKQEISINVGIEDTNELPKVAWSIYIDNSSVYNGYSPAFRLNAATTQ